MQPGNITRLGEHIVLSLKGNNGIMCTQHQANKTTLLKPCHNVVFWLWKRYVVGCVQVFWDGFVRFPKRFGKTLQKNLF